MSRVSAEERGTELPFQSGEQCVSLPGDGRTPANTHGRRSTRRRGAGRGDRGGRGGIARGGRALAVGRGLTFAGCCVEVGVLRFNSGVVRLTLRVLSALRPLPPRDAFGSLGARESWRLQPPTPMDKKRGGSHGDVEARPSTRAFLLSPAHPRSASEKISLVKIPIFSLGRADRE